MDLFDCVTVIIIVRKPSPGDWMCCACLWMDCDGFDLAVRLNCQKYFCQGQKFSSCSTASLPQTLPLWINNVCLTSSLCISLSYLLLIIFPLVFNSCLSFPLNRLSHCTHLILSSSLLITILFSPPSPCSQALPLPVAQARCRSIW